MSVVARQQYDERPKFASDLDFKGEKSLTHQADAIDCDLNRMFAKYEKGGSLPELIARDASYGDFASVPDLMQSIEISRRATEVFNALDARVRDQFGNDPVKFHVFVHDPKNEDTLAEWGLLSPEAVERRKKAREELDKQTRAEYEAKREADEKALIARIKAELQKTPA